MLIKAVTVFLLVVAVLAMLGRLRMPGAKRLGAARCAKCGRLRIGKDPCPCGRA